MYSVRKFFTSKLSSHENTRSLFSFIFKIFYSITGSSHVLPDFYILGGQKCGTTSMFMYLTRHPAILSPNAKDIRFFDKYFFKGVNWYRVNFPSKSRKSLLGKSFKHVLTGEGTERYFDHPHAPQRIKQVTPHAKFIILLRNPIDRSYSHYKMISRRHAESLPFEKAIQEEDRIIPLYQKMIDDPSYYSDIYFRHGYLHRGIYVDKIKHWMEIFPKEQFLIIQSEEFFRDPSKIYNQVLDFLGVENFELDTYRTYGKVNKNRKIDSIFYNELLDYFKPHNQRLYELLGRKFDWE
jgi:hypothetical protein